MPGSAPFVLYNFAERYPHSFLMSFPNCFCIFTVRPCPSCYSSSFFSPPHGQSGPYSPAILISLEHSHRQGSDATCCAGSPCGHCGASRSLRTRNSFLGFYFLFCVHSLPSESTMSPLVSNLFPFPHLPVKRRPLRSQTTRGVSSSSRLGIREGTI